MKTKDRISLLAAAGALALVTVCLSGCADLGYYWQSVSGHARLMTASRPINDWIDDASTPEQLRSRLALSQQIRSFAVSELKLPDNASYHRYADLRRGAVVWNVVAAPELSLTLKTWCFVVAGCVGYRGYFDEAEARAEADHLKQQGLEVNVYGVHAYSTLGWLNWAGGDPLLNTFINYPEGELARLVFHELAHQVVYAAGDTVFNESFATAVERLGSARWLAERASPAARQEYASFEKRRQQFRELTLATREQLQQIYEQKEAGAPDPGAQLAMKNVAMSNFTTQYAALKNEWGGYSGYDAYVAGANNASFGAQAAYDDLVPAFENLFEREGHDWLRFYDAVRQLAKLPKAERLKALKNP